MKKIMPPRYQAGADFFDQDLIDCYRNIDYPEKWLEEAREYAPEDAYVISHPSWFLEPIPPVPMISIYQLFKKTVEKYPDDTAVIFLDKKISYKDLDLLICKSATMLKDLGIGKGDVIATMLPNSLQHIVAFYSVTMIGAIHTPIDVMFQAKEVAYQIKDSGARNLFTLDILYEKVQELKEDGQLDNIIVTNVKDWAAPDAVIPKSIKYFWETPKKIIPETIK